MSLKFILMHRKFKASLVLLLVVASLKSQPVQTQSTIDSLMPIRGFSIKAPQSSELDSFIKFIATELAPRKVNTLMLLVDYGYQYKSHPELRDSLALSTEEVKKIVAVCRKNNIRLIPQINLLGHQSEGAKLNRLLEKYPEFDETPYIKMPAVYAWPNDDDLYCKSYCPLHPGVHKIVFDLVDEICDVFESTAFHAGMDEVFYLGDEKCPRCQGRDNAELFAGEVTAIRNHVVSKGRELWIWGDRLLDGKTTGMGMWEASYNNTYRAVDLIPKDVLICDWHYERPDKSAVYFAMKGFRVITCPWRDPDVVEKQVADMVSFRKDATKQVKENYQGMMQTSWDGASGFMRKFYENKPIDPKNKRLDVNCFRVMYKKIGELK